MVIRVNPVQLRNVFSLMMLTPLGIRMSVRLLHPSNALSPMTLTLDGMLMVVSFEHPQKANSSIWDTRASSETLSRTVHS